eukprot:TRINITY_DN8744_c0_g1::TRINITY_DN8744_c0_g1_i1::g.23901::m.23901 TRINITY_DN8744_c0_g1::TRINITY_DN8744_c0_g1_i1::g.23901  ORF type:complete len:187 (+),score=52.81,sp/P12759/RSP3_CHLRE/57.34/6e-31,Radial_spoke_3/PF06098.6/4.7e-49,FBPase/PF00316.15/0.13,RNase_H2-Ydr279/PF09468.5/1.2 TRINITY_DN8744_c0_g1_i1:40-561(+)
MEVLEEEELATLRAHQDEFDRIRRAELAETQRMEAAEKRRFEEKERRTKQEKERLEREEVVKQKVAARSFAKDYMSDMLSGVFSTLTEEGFFYNPLDKEVEEEFMPWLREAVESREIECAHAQDMVDLLIRGALELKIRRTTAGAALQTVLAEEAQASVPAPQPSAVMADSST